MSYKLLNILIAFLLTSCGYRGDGEYVKDGIWPFVNYSLDLPSFNLKSNSNKTFNVSGYGSHGSSILSVKLISDVPLSFEELDTVFELKVENGDGIHFYRNSSLNANYLRMVSLGEASWATELEWDGRYNYSAKEIKDRAVPFSTMMKPEKSKEMVYTQFLQTQNSDFKVTVKIGNVLDEFNNVKVYLSMSSDWK